MITQGKEDITGRGVTLKRCTFISHWLNVLFFSPLII